MEQGDDDELIRIEETMASLVKAPADRAAHARLAYRLRLRSPDAASDTGDPIVQPAVDITESDLWLARHQETIATGAINKIASRRRLCELASTAADRLSALLRLSDVLFVAGETEEAISALEEAVTIGPDHPTASALLAEAYANAGPTKTLPPKRTKRPPSRTQRTAAAAASLNYGCGRPSYGMTSSIKSNNRGKHFGPPQRPTSRHRVSLRHSAIASRTTRIQPGGLKWFANELTPEAPLRC